jgi:hypothetical protein
MASKTQICNFALSRLSAARITDITENTNSGKQCNAIFDLVTEFVMSQGPWPSCIQRVTLAQDADTPDWGYDYQYTLPTNPKCLRVLTINEDQLGSVDFKIENGKLLTDESDVDIQYIGLITDTESFDTYLTQAIIENLAAELCYTFTGSAENSAKMKDLAIKKTLDLLNQACIPGSGTDIPSDAFTRPRF